MHVPASPSPRLQDPVVIGPLGEGGMAQVYLGRPGPDGPLIVLKRLKPELGDRADLRDMFEDEIRVSRLVSGHPNIVGYVDDGELDEHRFLASEFVDGPSLAEVLDRLTALKQPAPPEIVVRIGLDLLDGLDHAHTVTDERGSPLALIHRDVTPQNILLPWGGGLKLLDFGVCKNHGRQSATEAGIIKGKPYFMSPEQLRGGVLDARSDLFAVGINLYYLLTLAHPFSRPESGSLISQICAGQPLSPTEYLEDPPVDLCRTILRALAHDPDHRFDSAAEMRSSLARECVSPASPEVVARFLRNLGLPRTATRDPDVAAALGPPADPLTMELVPRPISEPGAPPAGADAVDDSRQDEIQQTTSPEYYLGKQRIAQGAVTRCRIAQFA